MSIILRTRCFARTVCVDRSENIKNLNLDYKSGLHYMSTEFTLLGIAGANRDLIHRKFYFKFYFCLIF